MKSIDVTAMGEILIDFTYAGNAQNGMRLFEQNPGGAPANVLAAVTRLGSSSAFIGKVGDDMHGEFLLAVMKEVGIDTTGAVIDKNAFTTLAFVNLSPSGERCFSFARKPGADTLITDAEVNTDIIKNSKIFHVGSLSLTDEPARSALFYALNTAKEAGVTISYDPNYRAMLWKSEDDARKNMRSLLPYADIIKISDEETLLLTDCAAPEDAAEALYKSGISCVIVTLGKNGALIRTKAGVTYSKPYDVPVADTTGAGDAFMGGFLYSLTSNGVSPDSLTAKDVKSFSDFSNAVASLCVGRRGAIYAMPTLKETAELTKTRI